ncbi:cytochrome b [Sphingomonas sp. MG17]|uniref:Cytochrome b n=1 Tax=Sphingomonas tagetis TaxID=2949092 RepID=A0A9X2HM21_9SPHN|nr:cytochrome b [Sphingomonas tagetis]MCP3732617.1 cytochrome b [Sphingomonas tagetis]
MTVDHHEATRSHAAAVRRFPAGLIVIHWLSALLIAIMLATGWWMMELIDDPRRMTAAFPIFQFHKSLGLVVLAAAFFRIVLRTRRRVPALPRRMPGWERLTAFASHAALYILLVTVPLSGWSYISTQWAESLDKEFRAPSLFFGLVPIPYFPVIAEAEGGLRRALSFHLSGVHAWLAYGLLVLALFHVAAALKHHFIDRDNVLGSMLPGIRQPDAEDGEASAPHKLTSGRVWLIAGGGIVALALLGWLFNPPPPRRSVDTTIPVASAKIP